MCVGGVIVIILRAQNLRSFWGGGFSSGVFRGRSGQLNCILPPPSFSLFSVYRKYLSHVSYGPEWCWDWRLKVDSGVPSCFLHAGKQGSKQADDASTRNVVIKVHPGPWGSTWEGHVPLVGF